MSATSTKLRRATSAAQALLRETDSSLVIDGKPGSYTLSVYERSSRELKSMVDSVVFGLGLAGGLVEANRLYKGLPLGGRKADTSEVFDLKVVPAVIREARRRNVNPLPFLSQLCLESGYGAKTPRDSQGNPSYNYGGIKASVSIPAEYLGSNGPTAASSNEFAGGKMVRSIEKFHVFKDAESFVRAYFYYLLDGTSSYRYKGLTSARSVEEFAKVLKDGNYATDPDYVAKLVKTSKSVQARYIA